MSAYICGKTHIIYIVSAALSRLCSPHHGPFTWGLKDETKRGQWRHEQLGAGDFEKAAEVANMLWMENIRSVSARYPNESSANLPGPIGETFEIMPREFGAFTKAPDIAQLFKAIDCYAYQSCEHDEWEKSESFAFIQSLRRAAWHALPGYEDAAWGAPHATALA